MYGKSIENKTDSYNVILVKPFPGAHIKAMKYYVSLDLEKTPDLVIVHTDTNNLKSVSSPEEIEIHLEILFVKEKGQKVAVSEIVPRGDRCSRKAKDFNDC